MDLVEGVVGVDFETVSACPIGHGAWPYSEHPSTRILCAVFIYSEGGARRVFRWNPGDPFPGEVAAFVDVGGYFVAHNVGFEHSIWENVGTPRYGWPSCPEHWHDTNALGLAVNLPPTLEGLAAALGCPTQKDLEGAELMKRLCVAVEGVAGDWCYTEPTPAELERLTDYCQADVDATLDCYYRLPPLTLTEKEVYRVDQKVNRRGVYLDVPFALRCSEVVEARKKALDEEAFSLTAGELANSTSTPALKRWLKGEGLTLPMATRIKADGRVTRSETLDAGAVADFLASPGLKDEVRALLKNRQEANKVTSLAKLKRVPNLVGRDGRLRYSLLFCGANTARWTSYGLQVHNLPKNKMDDSEALLVRECLQQSDLDSLTYVHPRPLEAVSQSLRSVLAAPPGRDLIGGDYAAIEARVVAWLAGQDNILAEFARGSDVYVYTAGRIGSKSRALGKVCVLALGYGMGALKFVSTADSWGVTLAPKEAKRIHTLWRKENPAIVSFWAALEEAAINAIENPGKAFPVGRITAVVKKNCLHLRLPSGRALRYWRPSLALTTKKVKTLDEDGTEVEIELESLEIRFFSVAKSKRAMWPDSTYGGKLVENVTQATARDLLAEALVRLEKSGLYTPVVHVHDSIAAEVPEGAGSVEEFCRIMAEAPRWAGSLPLFVEGYRAPYFRG